MTSDLYPAEHTQVALDQSWTALRQTGGWFTGEVRVQIAREARSARDCDFCRERKAALSPSAPATGPGSHQSNEAGLNPAMVDAIHRITTDPGRLSRGWSEQVAAAGIAAEELVEMTSVIGVVSIADTMARALSQPLRALPVPDSDQASQAPHRTPLAGTSLARGWVPMVEPDSAEGFVKIMYAQVEGSAGFVFNVARALTSVPEALRDFFSTFLPNYTTHGPVRPGGLTRPQVELLAATTSAYNDCFY